MYGRQLQAVHCPWLGLLHRHSESDLVQPIIGFSARRAGAPFGRRVAGVAGKPGPGPPTGRPVSVRPLPSLYRAQGAAKKRVTQWG